MDKYKISIIIPTFNLEEKIQRAFKSIKDQTIGFENLEVIFVDDSSTDDTFNIISELANNNENVEVFKTDENSGYAGKPRNIGLKHATSEYIMFLDGDDELLIDSCEVLYNKIVKTTIDVVIGGQINVFDGIHQHNPPSIYGDERTFNDAKNSEILNINPAISAKLFKKKLLSDHHIIFPEGIPGEDLVFVMEALLNSNKILRVNNFYVYYRILSNESVSFDINETYLKGLIKSYTIVCELYDKFEVPKYVQEKAIYQHLRFFTLQTLRTNIESNRKMLHDLFNSDLFNTLADKNTFKDNRYYEEFFENMRNGEYENYHLFDLLSNSFKEEESDLKILNEKLKDENGQLKNKYDSIYHENLVLNNSNENLNNENTNMKKEISILEEQLKDAKFKQAIIDDENIYLKKDNIKLYEKCDELQKELDEIKSSKLWKLTNKS